jgi:D-glycero-alpha-D-manno-heptose-7-phosphate kinase
LQDNLILVYSGKGRSANSILQKQQAAMEDKDKFALVRRSRDKAYTATKYVESGDLDSFGDMLHSAWIDKKGVVSDISEDYFDVVYNKAIKAGASGGKLLGAGGGGFFVFYVTPSKREEVIDAVTTDTECKIYDFNFYDHGSRIVSQT